MTDEKTYSKASSAQIIKPERFYIAAGSALLIDQPSVGFETEGAAKLYIRGWGRHVNTERFVVVPGSAVT